MNVIFVLCIFKKITKCKKWFAVSSSTVVATLLIVVALSWSTIFIHQYLFIYLYQMWVSNLLLKEKQTTLVEGRNLFFSTAKALWCQIELIGWLTGCLYLMDSCTPMAEVAGRQHLQSASQWKLIVPRYRLNSFGRQCFAVAGPSTWNSLPDSLRDPALSLNIFKRQLKTHFFCKILTRCTERIRDFFENVLYKFTLYLLYLLTDNVKRCLCKYKRSEVETLLVGRVWRLVDDHRYRFPLL